MYFEGRICACVRACVLACARACVRVLCVCCVCVVCVCGEAGGFGDSLLPADSAEGDDRGGTYSAVSHQKNESSMGENRKDRPASAVEDTRAKPFLALSASLVFVHCKCLCADAFQYGFADSNAEYQSIMFQCLLSPP